MTDERTPCPQTPDGVHDSEQIKADEHGWRTVRCRHCGREVTYRSSDDMTDSELDAWMLEDRLAHFEDNGWPVQYVVVVHDPDGSDWTTWGPYDGPEAIRRAEACRAECATAGLPDQVHIAFHYGLHDEPPD